MKHSNNSYNGRNNQAENRQSQRIYKLERDIEEAIEDFDDYIARIAEDFNETPPIVHSTVFNVKEAEDKVYHDMRSFTSGNYESERAQNIKLYQLEHRVKELENRESLPRQLTHKILNGYPIPSNTYIPHDDRDDKRWEDYYNAGFTGAQRKQNDRMTEMELTLERIMIELEIVQETVEKVKFLSIYNNMMDNNLELLEKSITLGASLADIDTRDGKNALERAWDLNNLKKHPGLMDLILENSDAELVNAHFSNEKSPLRRAVDEDNPDMVRTLCTLGADINEGNGLSDTTLKPTLLHSAIANDSPEVIKALLENGANPNIAITGASYAQNTTSWVYRTCCGGLGVTPLHTAVQKYINISRGYSESSASYYQENTMEIMKALVRNGANPNATDSNNITPLQMLQDASLSSIAVIISQEYKAASTYRHANRNTHSEHMRR